MKKIVRKLYAGASGTLLCTIPKEVKIALNLKDSDIVSFEIVSETEIKVKKVEI